MERQAEWQSSVGESAVYFAQSQNKAGPEAGPPKIARRGSEGVKRMVRRRSLSQGRP